MKYSRLFFVAAVFMLALLTGCDSSEPGKNKRAYALPKVGSAAPDFQLKDLDGDEYSLSSLRGKVVLVNFWATWCPPCRREMPSMEELYLNYGKEDFEILAINVDDNGREVMPAFLEKTPHSFPILFDSEFQARTLYGVAMFPETFIVDKNGIIAAKVVGERDWTSPEILSGLNTLLKGQ